MATESDDDVMDDGEAVDPSLKPKSSKGWLKLIKDQEKAGFADYQERCTNIQKRYAELARLASITRDREFQIFWANIEVLKPSMYSRPPVPVVAPRFQDRRPVQRTTAEFLERCTVVTFDRERIDGVMRRIRDDLALLNRGCAWLRYEAKSKDNDFVERVCIDHKNRKDFVHDPARTWREVDWVGGGAWMTRKEMRKRFRATSGNAYQDAEFAVRKDDKNNHDGKLKARVWEIWSKSENKVVWVSPGVDVVLDEGEPHLTLEGFFPCPEPAYGTLQPESLIPVPDYLFYKDQIEEINDITNRISALTQGLRVRGFYPSGAGEIGDAIEAALKSTNDRQVMVPVSNWAAFGNGAAKDTIVWLPLDMIATTITQLISLRKELIDDIYQISGLSDIMRGESNPNETLGAQQIKTQYGSVRIRDRQNELVRIARDIAAIAGEIMAENFQQKTLADMAQMDLPANADISKQVKALEAQGKSIAAELQQAQSDPEIAQMAKQNPEAAQQIMQQAQGQLQQISQQVEELKKTVTIEQVMDLLQDQRMRPFNLDIETDSTIQPDENAEKQHRTEFLSALGTTLAQLAPMVQSKPETAPFAAELLKFAVAPFRPGRSMDAAIDEFAEKMKASAGQPQPDPAAAAQKADADAKAADQKLKQYQAAHDAQLKDAAAKQDAESKRVTTELQVKNLIAAGQAAAQKHQQDMEKSAVELQIRRLELAALQTPEPAAAVETKGPSESIAFKDLPPEGQAQMAQQAGITLSPQEMADHTAGQDAKKAADAAAKAQKGSPHAS
ncbi:hypothetical protein [Mesorhizobium sp. M7D.F.Ca.US.004.01.2.1]|uniref:hypothetical protein n=1 Tax=Mesorhizobium sp. M7D.F.Ca.US.004.01.2.1 TaxID=2496738 RepID=UPI000FCCBCDF|nr:hypothetical protein [Mesorhizobium sp. M7D.F.Ca.US.004.01.2.1]RUX96157.1 hypothetical protein EN993_08940 [Mesorhizobium sp. M7D.F.Ca.US.004.01.2.1]